ncbi:MAG: ShlB/FhaC/HecB family hemolysin secretion/activation protein [Rubrivivax sp.]
MSIGLRREFRILLLALASAFGPWAAAQEAPKIVPTPPQVPRSSDLGPPRAPESAPAVLPPQPAPPRELGKPDQDLRLDVTRYAVPDDAPAELRNALPRLTERYTGKGRSFEDLSNAAAEVTRFLQRELGYYLGYAYLPEQVPADGVVRIAILEGRLDRIVLEWSDGLPVDREVVEGYLSRLVPGTILKVRDVERVVFLVNDLRGITTRFEVRAGSLPGTASLVVTPRAEPVWAGRADLDANGSRYMGLYRLGGLVQRNSPFGRGDGFTASLLGSTTGGLAFALLGYNTPVGGDGLKLGASLSAVRYRLNEEASQLDLNGSAYTFNGYLLYPVVRARNLNLFTLASYDRKAYDDRNLLNSTRKDVDTLTFGTTGDFRDSVLGGGVNTFEFNVIGGRLNYPGGARDNTGVGDRFGKFTLGYTRLQDLVTGRALIYFSLRGQYAVNNLDNTEQFRVGGPDGVRAYAPGEGTGDRAYVGSVELRWLPPESLLGRNARDVVAALFYDFGHVRFTAKPETAVDASNAKPGGDTFTAAGLGLAWVRPGAFALRISVAKPIAGTPRAEPDKDPRVYLQGSVFFN